MDCETCPICLDDLDRDYDIVTTRCKHTFCFSCLLKNIKIDNKCPLCRNEIEEKRPFNYKQITYNDLMKY